MRNISKWILAGGLLAVAFGCQCQTKKSDNNQNEQQDQKQDNRGCSKLSSETPTGKSTVEGQKLAPSQTSAPEKSAVAETKANPVSAVALPVPEQKQVPSLKEPAVPAPITSAGPAAAPAPEVKAERSTSSAAAK